MRQKKYSLKPNCDIIFEWILGRLEMERVYYSGQRFCNIIGQKWFTELVKSRAFEMWSGFQSLNDHWSKTPQVMLTWAVCRKHFRKDLGVGNNISSSFWEPCFSTHAIKYWSYFQGLGRLFLLIIKMFSSTCESNKSRECVYYISYKMIVPWAQHESSCNVDI